MSQSTFKAPTESEVEAATKSMVDDLKSGDVDSVLIGAADVNGMFRGKRIPARDLAKDPAHGAHFSDLLFVLDLVDEMLVRPAGFSGYWPEWENGFADVVGVPDPLTYRRVPWSAGTGLVLLDFHDLEGNPAMYAPRQVLRRVLDQVPDEYIPMVAPELEFCLFKGKPDELADNGFREIVPLSSTPSTYGVARAASDEHLLGPIRKALTEFGIEPEAAGAEAGFGQYELNVPPSAALQAADSAFLFKQCVREVADNLGYTASFMARPVAEGFGSSLHLNESLWSLDGTNAFHDPDGEHRLSKVALQFIAGLMATLREFTVLLAPTVNSYKRLTGESAAGTTASWSVQNRTVTLRASNDSVKGTRVEHRSPGADANPYLAIAATIAGGLWGIENELDPGDPYSGNTYTDSSLETVPRSLTEAVDLFEQSEAANRYLGEPAVRYFAATRRAEVEMHAAAITDWEVSRYLTRI